MSTKRVALALSELAEALFELIESGEAGAPSSPPAPPARSDEPRPVGNCPIHGFPFRTKKKDGTPTRPYCASRMEDGNWCKERPA